MKVVWIRWQDAAFISDRWRTADKLPEPAAFQLLSAGVLVKETAEGTYLATDYATDEDTYRYTSFIPRHLVIARGEFEVDKV